MGKKGFTIIELLIVMAVIAILVGIALPRFKGMRDVGYVAQAKGELRTLQTAVESYRVHTGAYPSALSSLTSATPNIIGSTLPTDPFGSAYQFADDGATSVEYYVIYSVGLNSIAGVCTVSTAGVVAETAGDPIYVTNGGPIDTTP